MPATVLSGKKIAGEIKAEVAAEVADLREVHGISPCLVAVRVGEDAASAVYVGSKVKTANELGILSEHAHLPADVSRQELASLIGDLNTRNDVDGILIQLPLPKHLDERALLELVDPVKDVDGFHPVNAGKLALGYSSLVPCTPAGVIEILQRSGMEIAGRRAVVVGRSNIVGKPLALLLLAANATVTICHSRTRDLAGVTREGEILIAAIGRTGFIGEGHIREGATVIDVGINTVSDPAEARGLFEGEELENRLATIERRGSTLVGDVNPTAARRKASAYTPVPGGVGLLTVAMLMKNTVKAAKMRRGIADQS